MVQCFCDASNGYVEIVVQGSRTCVCPEGYQQNEASECVLCPVGTYKDVNGNVLVVVESESGAKALEVRGASGL